MRCKVAITLPMKMTFSDGDYVIVPVGKGNHYFVAEVMKAECFAEKDVLLPLERTKHIIRKCTDKDMDDEREGL